MELIVRKKFLQEHEFDTQRLTEPLYRPLDKAELAYQNITLKSKVDEVALNDYKAGLNPNPNDYNRAQDKVDAIDRYNKYVKQQEYPRLVGPIPPEPYESIYCAEKIIEHGDGYKKRTDLRVYDSPFVHPQAKYEPLKTDIQTLHESELKKQQHLKSVNENYIALNESAKAAAAANAIPLKDKTLERVSRKVNEVIKEKFPISIHEKDYSQYSYQSEEKCPKNTFYESIEYTTQPKIYEQLHQSRLTTLQDRWNKSQAQNQFLKQYPIPSADLRDNIRVGKKLVTISPLTASKNLADLEKQALKSQSMVTIKSARP